MKNQDHFLCYEDNNGGGFDVSYSHEKEINLEETSKNLDFKVSTFQSKCENIYYNISLYDYVTQKEYSAGYFYIKNYSGIIGKLETTALYDIISIGNELTEEIFYNRLKKEGEKD